MTRIDRNGIGGILVACPKTQHSYQAALALQERGLLSTYVTGFYYKKSGIASRIASVVPRKYRHRVERELRRRRLDELDDSLIETVPFGELLCSIIERKPALRQMSSRLRLWDYHVARFQRHVAKMIRQRQPAMVICYDSCALEIFDAARETGAICVLDQSIGHITQYVSELRAAGLEINVPEQQLAQSIAEARAADIVLASSNYVRESLIRIGIPSQRVLVLPFGVDLQRFHPAERPRSMDLVRALYVGQLSVRKGVGYLVDAFDRLAHPDLELVMVGRQLGDPKWTRPRDRFIYHPALPQHEIDRVYRQADFFVQLSLHEGSTLTVFEALASGLPVITTPNAGSVVRDGIEGFIVPPRDVEAVTDRIRVLSEDHDLRRAMAQRARARAEQFSWTNYRTRLSSALGAIVQAATLDRADVLDVERVRLAEIVKGDGERSLGLYATQEKE